MDPLTIPEDLTAIEDDAELSALAEAAAAQAQELAEADNVSAEDADRIEQLVGDVERITAELNAREETREANRARASEALSRITPAAAADDDEDDADDDAAPAGTDDDDAAADADTDVADDATGDTPDDAEVAEVELTPQTEHTEVEDPVDQPEPIAASARKVPAQPKRAASAAGLRNARGGKGGVRPTEPTTVVAEFSATPQARAYAAGTKLDQRKLAEAICEVRNRFGNRIPDGVREPIVIATAGMEYPDGQQLAGMDPVQNYSIFRKAMRKRSEAAQALVASGGNPAPLPTVYDIFRAAEPQTPVENALPVVGAPRGGIKWIRPLALGESAAGIGVTTEAEDAAGYVADGGPTADKPFVTFGGVTEDSKEVTAVSKGVKFGNLGFRTFPEWVEDRLLDLAVIFARTKEELYLDAIDTQSTAVTHTTDYGAARGLLYSHMLAAAKHRKELNVGVDTVLDLYLPTWVAELVMADAINDHSQGMDVLLNQVIARATVAAKFRNLGLNVVWYYDEAGANGQAFRAAQAAGALTEFPATVVSYLHLPGTFVRLDGGTLEVGLYRDSTLNRTNDLEIFSEQWVEVAKVGIKSVKLTTTTEPSGVGPEPVAPMGATV